MKFDLSVSIVISLWLGFVLAISFMESWLKFRAKGVTLPIGLSIGSLVFRALNLVEWTAALTLGLIFMVNDENVRRTQILLVSGASGLLLVQTLWLLPALGRRAKRVINGGTNPRSRLHLIYVSIELLKAGTLGGLLVKTLLTT